MWCAVWCALMMAGSVWSETVPSTNGLAQPIDWAQLDSSLPDDVSNKLYIYNNILNLTYDETN